MGKGFGFQNLNLSFWKGKVGRLSSVIQEELQDVTFNSQNYKSILNSLDLQLVSVWSCFVAGSDLLQGTLSDISSRTGYIPLYV